MFKVEQARVIWLWKELTSTASSDTRGALVRTQMGSLGVLQPGLAYGLITGELATMSPAIQHHVLGFSHLLHTSWLSWEGALSFCVLVRNHSTRRQRKQPGWSLICCLIWCFDSNHTWSCFTCKKHNTNMKQIKFKQTMNAVNLIIFLELLIH